MEKSDGVVFYADLHDTDLVRRFREGDGDAATELWRRYVHMMLFRVRRKLANSMNRAALDSQAIVNSGFMSFFKKIEKEDFDPQKWQIGALLSTIVCRKASQKLRRKFIVIRDPQDLSSTRDAVSALLDAKLVEPEVAAVINEAIDAVLEALTPRERQIIELFLDEAHDYSIKEIATLCNRQVGTVQKAVKEFCNQLRERLNEE